MSEESNDPKNPERWADDPEAPKAIAGALRDAREELPTEAQLAAVAATLGPLLGGGGGGAGGGGGGAGGPSAVGGASAAGIASGTKVVTFLVGGSLLIAAVGTWAVVADRRARPRQQPEETAEMSADGGVTPIPDGGVDSSTLMAPPTAMAENQDDEGPEAAEGEAPTPSPSTREPEPEPARVPELALLQQAQDALGRSPAEALALADRHADDYPVGALAQEREVLAVDALLRLGRRDEAEARAARFRDAHPGSGQIRRLEQLLRER